MKMRKRVIDITVGICLFGTISAAYAENFVLLDSIGGGVKVNAVDVDSIRKGDDGLVYYTENRQGNSLEYSAIDCQKRILYMLSSWDLRFKESYKYPDWRSDGRKVVPGSHGALLADFVCSRAR
jgi:hypothetical protein